MVQSDLRKVSILGLGNVGATAAYAILLNGLVDHLVLYARSKEKAIGEKLDLEHALPFLRPADIVATDDFAQIAGSDVIVVAAGVAQKPGETRLDLVKNNVAILESIAPQIAKHAPDSVVLLVANPVDILTYTASQMLGFARGKVFGSGTMLDSARFRFHLAEKLTVSPRSIHAYILGEHGDTSFPAVSHATVGGQLLSSFPSYSEAMMQEVYAQVKQAAYNIIQAKGATYYAIGVIIAELVKTILHNSHSVVPVSIPLTDYYGVSDVSLSVPCVVGRSGVEQVLKVELSQEEQEKLRLSADTLKKLI